LKELDFRHGVDVFLPNLIRSIFSLASSFLTTKWWFCL